MSYQTEIDELREQRVRVVGIGSFDRADALERLVRVDEIIAVDDDEEASPTAPPLEQQFRDLASLPDGWFEPGTPPLDRVGLELARTFLDECVVRGVPVPHIYPTPELEARAEWSLTGWEVSATFDLRASRVRLHATHLSSDGTESCELPLSAPEASETFSKFVRQFLPAQGDS